MRDGGAEVLSAIGDRGRAAISLTPDLMEHTFPSLKVGSLKVCMQETYCIV